MTTFEVRIEYNQDRKRDDYHIYLDGRFFITCETLKQVAMFRQIVKEEDKNANL